MARSLFPFCRLDVFALRVYVPGRMKRLLVLHSLWLALLLMAACATPDARIKRQQDLFDQFDPGIQEQIRAGHVDLGFDTNMVFLALGRPDREYERRTAAGQTRIWSYTDHLTRTQRQLVNGRFRVRDSRTGHIHSIRDSVWVDVPTYYEMDRLRIEFGDDGLVTAIEKTR